MVALWRLWWWAVAVLLPRLLPLAPVPSSSPAPAAKGADDVAFIWPTSGSLIAGLMTWRNKGYDISGKAGDSVVAAADGRVVYAGAGLRGYGNLIILKPQHHIF